MIYEINAKDNKGNEVKLADYKGQVMLIVNTATGCGFTPQYDGLQKLYETYADKGFEILDFPCNQFGNQAPGSNEEIATFCTGKFGLTFKMFDKIDVNGPNTAPLFQYLKKEKGGLLGSKIKWNFTKFLVDQEGTVLKRYAPTVKPEDIEKDIAALLS